MSIILIAVGIIFAILTFGLILGLAISRLDRAVAENKIDLEKASKSQSVGYNPRLTLGFQIKTEADKEEQLRQARLLAARQAAAQPRGANMGIGSREQAPKLRTAFKGAPEDPWTAAKIAAVHGWEVLQPGSAAKAAPAAAKAVTVATAAPAAPAQAPAGNGAAEPVPGVDYPFIEITDDMSEADKRKARIANAKAKSAAVKAAKASGAAPQAAPAGAPAAAAPAAATPAAAKPSASAAAAGIPEPNYIEITDSMSPDEVRKARIHNAKERSKFNKALKAAGIEPVDEGEAAPAAVTEAAAPAAAAPAAEMVTAAATEAADLAGFPKPEYIEITDSMSPDAVRKARIHNSKERAKYNKALKAAGIDPATVAD